MKKKIFIVALAACLLVLSVAGTSIAYFTDTEQYTNTFTVGNVAIKLTEAAVTTDALGNLVKDGTASRIVIDDELLNPTTTAYGKIFPGQTIYKDPTIEVSAGSESAYVGAIISIESTTFNSLVDDDQLDEFLTGLNTTDAAVTYEETTKGYKIYMIFTAQAAAGAECVLFEGIKVFNDWDHAEMGNLEDLKIVINAYATQTVGFADAKTALTSAFGGEGAAWRNVPTTPIPTNPNP